MYRIDVAQCLGRGVCINHAPASVLTMHQPYWPHRLYTVYMATLYTKQGTVKPSKLLIKAHTVPIGCHSKHASAIELLKLLIWYNETAFRDNYKGENGQQSIQLTPIVYCIKASVHCVFYIVTPKLSRK